MNAPTDTDSFRFVFVGAGQAALQLADALVAAGVRGSEICLLERASAFRMDRTFATFASDATLAGLPILKTWHRWNVRTDHGEARHLGRGRVYRQVDLAAFRDQIVTRLSAAGAQIRFGSDVEHVEPCEGGAVVRSRTGAIRAHRVFDSRPRVPSSQALLQSFTGLHLKSAVPLFDRGLATLMDFRTRQHGIGSFIYVLPYAEDEALVEATTIGGRRVGAEHHEADVWDYAQRVLGLDRSEVRVSYRESSAIVMDPDFEELEDRGPITRIGAAGGAIRPATGYGFAAGRRFAQRFAQRLVRSSDAPSPKHHPSALRKLDRIFLSHLCRKDVTAPELFLRFAQRMPSDRFARFLADDPNPSDLLRVATALPPAPILRTAMGFGESRTEVS